MKKKTIITTEKREVWVIHPPNYELDQILRDKVEAEISDQGFTVLNERRDKSEKILPEELYIENLDPKPEKD